MKKTRIKKLESRKCNQDEYFHGGAYSKAWHDSQCTVLFHMDVQLKRSPVIITITRQMRKSSIQETTTTTTTNNRTIKLTNLYDKGTSLNVYLLN